MGKIKILDCTLRDGGYVNSWNFGFENIVKIIKNLENTKVDFIECGFLKSCRYDKNKSLFSKISELENCIKGFSKDINYTLMINYGQYDIKKIPENKNENFMLRIAFKKEDRYKALEFSKLVKDKGYNIFINPMHTNTYNSKELLELIDEVNNINPFTFTIVDTTGALKEKDVLALFYLIDNNLSKNITLGFHSHNNLQLSFSNAQCLLKVHKSRDLIIDSTIFSIGRGAGNLSSELILQYVNDNYHKSYNITPVLKTINEQINPIFIKTPWGYSVPYYLAANHHCHPNYAKYLIDKGTIPIEKIETLIKCIPENKKTCYDVRLIEKLYENNFSNA